MIGERREARTKNQAQVFHRNVDVKGHSKLLAVPFNIGATNLDCKTHQSPIAIRNIVCSQLNIIYH